MNKEEQFYNDLLKNNKNLSDEELKRWAHIAQIYSEERKSYREEIYDVKNIEKEIFPDCDEDDRDFGRLYFCIDWLNETIRDISIVDDKLYFNADFKPYHFDGVVTGKFYASVEIYDEDDMYFGIELDYNYKITIKEMF